jgi:hypothetical protein
MTLKGEARTRYMREYMRRRRAKAPGAGLKRAPVKPASDTAKDARIRELEAELARERAQHEELPPLSKTERQDLAAYKRQIKSEVRRELEAQIDRRVSAEAWELLDYNIKLWLEQFRAAEKRIKDFDAKISRYKPIISRRTWRVLMAGAHPDRGGTNAAAVEVNENREAIEAALCGSEAEQRKWELTPPPMSRAELDAAREKVRAEHSERAKRAAATRAARKAADSKPTA